MYIYIYTCLPVFVYKLFHAGYFLKKLQTPADSETVRTCCLELI